MTKTNNRLAALEDSALKVARSLVNRGTLNVVTGGVNACWNFETDTLMLPNYDTDNPVGDLTPEQVTALQDAFRGTMSHEMSHAKNTNPDIVRAKQAEWNAAGKPVTRLHTLWHIFEDPYVETVWADEFPGSRKFIEASRQFVIAKTGGSKPCWANYTPPEGGKPMGLFGAFVQAVLRLYTGHVKRDDVDPDVLTLIDRVQDILDDFDPRAGTAHNYDMTERVWARLEALMNDESEDRDDMSQQTPSGGDEGDDGASAGGDEEPTEGTGDDGADNPGKAEGDDSNDADDGAGGGEGDEGDDGADNTDGNADAPNGGTDETTERHEGNDVGGAGKSPMKLAAEVIGGDWGDIPSAGELLAAEFVGNDKERVPYTVSPAVEDRWVTFGNRERTEGRATLSVLRGAVASETSYLANRLRRAIVSQRRELWVGAQEDGSELDVDSLPYLAANLDSRRIYSERFGKPAEDTFVCVVVDCSGSMGSSIPKVQCPEHGVVNQRGDKCSRKDYNGRRCGKTLKRTTTSKAGYAAMTATILHDALRQTKVRHAVLGYTTGWEQGSGGHEAYRAFRERQDKLGVSDNPVEAHGYQRWTRDGPIVTFEFVPAPGLSDRGDALPFITGHEANSDGCSIMEAAKYAAKHGRDCGRVILLVIADGLPAGYGEQKQEYAHLTRSVEQVAQAGIEVYGIGVGIRDEEQFRKFYPDNPGGGGRAGTGSVIIPSGKGLSRTVMGSMLNLFTRNNGRRR